MYVLNARVDWHVTWLTHHKVAFALCPPVNKETLQKIFEGTPNIHFSIP